MNTYYDSQFGKKIVTIYPGEYFSGSGEEYISTVLGSCISIALYDQKLKIGGLNHFMLAYDGAGTREHDTLAGRFGEYAMELLMNDLIKKGANRKYLSAKVFGGSNVLCTKESTRIQVGEANINFAFSYLEREKIPVVASNVGGTQSRKIFYDPASSKIWLKHIHNTIHEIEYIKKQEAQYAAQVREKEQHTGDIVWF
ncbi:chemotaxis protein CheD [Treponema brennaborense]|uniref:Probable chemoreceptor glutamine deamidase CheD n=1 Tax=Treponema brennaborense (strain DSM 12168 / CIP 105900 / DD5/3) TaxID=906968 RepID=F4LKV1_TREBD|nr:protein CheD [Treponema brennaborense]AEE15562.1 CheD [Treponema brennaborense DSM 12168]